MQKNGYYFPDNIGENFAIDETLLSNRGAIHFCTSRTTQTRQESLVAVVEDRKSEEVIDALKRIVEKSIKL